MFGNFDNPSIEVLSVEQINPSIIFFKIMGHTHNQANPQKQKTYIP
jgi:hypothetical protein